MGSPRAFSSSFRGLEDFRAHALGGLVRPEFLPAPEDARRAQLTPELLAGPRSRRLAGRPDARGTESSATARMARRTSSRRSQDPSFHLPGSDAKDTSFSKWSWATISAGNNRRPTESTSTGSEVAFSSERTCGDFRTTHSIGRHRRKRRSRLHSRIAKRLNLRLGCCKRR